MPAPGFKKLLRYVQVLCFCGAIALLILSAAIYVEWKRDNAILRRQALEVTGGARSASDAIVALNHWVYEDGGFSKNQRYFLFRPLGPTPVQILHSGGDCADKSRLLSAMLGQIGISSALVILYPCRTCGPIHTVVEAAYEKGRMVVDPIWDIEYPEGDGRYYGVRDLASTTRGRSRLMRLKAESSPTAKIASMPPGEATFDYARGLNWDKNAMTRMAAAVLRRMNLEPTFLPRPRILEDPQRAVWALLLVPAIVFFVMGLAVRSWRRRPVNCPSYTPVPGSH
jgi:hypothetical protein